MRFSPRATSLVISCLALAGLLLTQPAQAVDKPKKSKRVKQKPIPCELSFTLSGWSAFYKTAKGEGTVRCENGQEADVEIRVKGGGLTIGKSNVLDGSGKFAGVLQLSDVFGSYAAAEAHAGAVGSVDAVGMTKGPVSLAVAGTGRGFDLGIAFSRFKIKPAGD